MGWGYAFDPNKLQLSNNIKYRRKTQLKKKKKKEIQCQLSMQGKSICSVSCHYLGLLLTFFFLFLAIPHCSREFPDQGLNSCPQQWKCRVWATGTPRSTPTALVLDFPYFWPELLSQFPNSAPLPPSYAFNPSSFQTSVFLKHQPSRHSLA